MANMTTSPFHWLRTAGLAVLYVIVYVGLDWVSYVHPVLPLGITPWNPPPGLSVALLLIYRWRFAPALFVAPLAAEILVRGIPAPLPYLGLAAAAIAFVYIGATWLLRRLRFHLGLEAARDILIFLVVIVPATLIVALSYVGLFTLSGLLRVEDYPSNVARYWIGDLNGVLVVTLAILAWRKLPSSTRRWPIRLLWLIAAQTLTIASVLWIIFGLDTTDELKFFYLLFLPLIWIAVRWGIVGTALGLVGIQIGLILALQSVGYAAVAFVEFQFLMLALCITGLLLGAVVTERSRAQQDARDKQISLNRALQLAAAGEMTSALAHELNNPIAALANYLRACQVMLDAPERHRALLHQTLEKAVNEARRASEVLRRLRDFFRSGSIQLTPTTAQKLIGEAIALLADRFHRHGIDVRLEIAQDVPLLIVDTLQIETILHNLLSNSIDALVEQGNSAREIMITCYVSAGQIRIQVRDSGPGFASDLAERLFEPFNTSKPTGMGLGLAPSRSLAQAHGGDLRAVAASELGAAFLLSLPIDPISSAEKDHA